MRQLLVRLGRMKAVLVITAVSLVLSVSITLLILFLLSLAAIGFNLPVALTISTCAPLIIAPLLSWYIIGLLLEINTIEGEMRVLATYDSLTGLLNRRAFLEQADYVCHLVGRNNLGFCFLLVDLDNFKRINDRHGHATGDKVLESFGRVCSWTSRKSDLAGRIGGEEFAFLLPCTTADEALNFCDRLHEAVRRTNIEEDNERITYTISIGVASFPRTVAVETALNLADKALYDAKEHGKNKTVVRAGQQEAV